ncbi:MAG TPA: transcriptional regulator [Geobacter sp.]|nr:transcriptional regulator [Geobacter sp.]
MPLYEYQCKSCNHNFELRQKFSDEPASVCPACGGEVEKLISQSGFALKGAGWYGDGYGSGSGSKAAAPACPTGGKCAGCPSAS